MGKIYTRAHKYKAWHRTEKKMYYVSAIHFNSDGTTGDKEPIATIDLLDNPNALSTLRVVTPNDIELLQYTNLNDKDEKNEIYEGDVMRDPENKHVYEVLFRADRYMLERMSSDPKNPGYELADLYPLNEELGVVGNIFEHPELLKQVGYSSLE